MKNFKIFDPNTLNLRCYRVGRVKHKILKLRQTFKRLPRTFFESTTHLTGTTPTDWEVKFWPVTNHAEKVVCRILFQFYEANFFQPKFWPELLSWHFCSQFSDQSNSDLCSGCLSARYLAQSDNFRMLTRLDLLHLNFHFRFTGFVVWPTVKHNRPKAWIFVTRHY